MGTATTRLRAATALIALWIPLIAVSAAHAGEYTVDACQTPVGERVLSTGGWIPESSSASQACESEAEQYPALYATWGSAGVHLEYRGWTFASPAGTSIVGYELQRWFEGPASGGIWWSVFTDDARREICGPPGCTSPGSPFVPQLSPVNRVAADVDVTRLRVGLFCLTDEGCPAPAHPVPRFNVMAARVRLAEEIPPRFLEPPSGSLLTPVDVLTGEKSVSVPVADGGSGLAQAGLRIDGRDYAA